MRREFSPFNPDEIVDALRATPGAPPRLLPGLRDVLELAFYASLLRNEGQSLSFSLALPPPEVTLPYETALEEPCELSLEACRRLGPIAPSDRSCLRVEAKEGPPGFVITALAGHPRSWITADAAGPAGDTVAIDVLGPGAIALSSSVGTVHYRDGQLNSPNWGDFAQCLSAQLVDGWTGITEPHPEFDTTVGSGALLYDPDALAIHRAAYNSLVSELVPLWLLAGVGQILWEIDRRAHGGAIMWVHETDAKEARKAVERLTQDGVRLAVPVSPDDGRLWSSALRDCLLWNIHLRLAREHGVTVLKGVPSSAHASPKEWAENVARHRLREAADALDRRAKQYADLAQVDGAVFLDALLEPIALGVKLPRATKAGLPDPMRAYFDDHPSAGTRHLSAAAAAAGRDDLTALVVSQDGGVTLFHHLFGAKSFVL